jgi:hypothetical protein
MTDRIEQPANRVTGIQQRMRCQRSNIDQVAVAKSKRCTVRSENIIGRQCEAIEPGVHTLIVPDPDMNLAAFEQRYLVHAESIRQLDAHIGEALGVSRQESGQDALDRLRRRSHLEYAGISTFEQLDPLAERSELTQNAPTIFQELLASGGQEKAAADAIEQLKATFIFEVADLS